MATTAQEMQIAVHEAAHAVIQSVPGRYILTWLIALACRDLGVQLIALKDERGRDGCELRTNHQQCS